MISRAHRFHGHASLGFVYRKGRSVRGQYTSLKFVLNSRRDSYRLAIVVSKKVSKSAVVRNRIRRRIYEVTRRMEAEINAPYDLVVTVFSDQLAVLPANRLEAAIRAQFEQAGVIGGSHSA